MLKAIPRFALLLAILINAPVSAASRFDGTWWISLGTGERLAYLVGFYDGHVYARQMFDTAGIATSKSPEQLRIVVTAQTLAAKQMDRDLKNVLPVVLMDGLNKVYADYRNVRIEVKDAMYVVFRSMDGTSDDEVAKILEYHRKKSSE
jgi:hypothetical protein